VAARLETNRVPSSVFGPFLDRAGKAVRADLEARAGRCFAWQARSQCPTHAVFPRRRPNERCTRRSRDCENAGGDHP